MDSFLLAVLIITGVYVIHSLYGKMMNAMFGLTESHLAILSDAYTAAAHRVEHTLPEHPEYQELAQLLSKAGESIIPTLMNYRQCLTPLINDSAHKTFRSSDPDEERRMQKLISTCNDVNALITKYDRFSRCLPRLVKVIPTQAAQADIRTALLEMQTASLAFHETYGRAINAYSPAEPSQTV